MPHDRLNMIYKTACKRDITNRKELDRFLVATTLSQFLEHDCFSFDMKVQVNRRVDKEKLKGFICEDFSEGKENRPIPMYNQVDNDRPPDMIYYVRPILHESARINMEKEFLLSCDCTDGCRRNCPCNRQTAEGAEKLDACYRNYVYGRLVDIIATGIFECNSNCKCKNCIDKPCQNSIVQRGLRQDLQLFKTFKKGWGVRTMSDIPFGAFICIYAGIVRSEDEAERHGRKLGDEYFANLDYIESGERTKWDVNRNKDSGKESADSEEETEYKSDDEKIEKKDGEQAFAPASHHFINSSQDGKLRRSSRKRKKTVSKKSAKNKSTSKKEKNSEKDEKSEKQIDHSDSDEEWSRTREFFQTEEELKPQEDRGKRIMYVIDAKHQGNFGRYLNHSCAPNLDTQNVIINTADLRMPTVAFFARRNIKAGEELCWDYQYSLDPDREKGLKCFCGTSSCRGRLR